MKRIIPITIIVLSVVFFIASLLGLVAVWVGNQSLTDDLLARIQTVDSDLQKAQSTFQTARLELESTQEQIDLIQSVIAAVGIDSQENVRVITDIIKSFDETLSPLIDTVANGVGKLSEAFLALKKVVESLNALPLISLEIPGADKLEQLSSSIAEQQAQVVQLREKIQHMSQLTEDTLNTLTTGYTEFETTIDGLLVMVTEYETMVTDHRTQLVNLQTNIPKWIDQASIILTVGLLWLAFSQVGLFILAWSFYKGEDLLDRWR